MSKTFSQSDVASHNKGDNLWIIVDEDVYDLTKFQDEHPGKSSQCSLLRMALTFSRWQEE
jgi:cytochrome b involved in lipid metabolism